MARARVNSILRSRRAASSEDRFLRFIREVNELFARSDVHRRIAEAHYDALSNYTPSPYPGRITLFRARVQPLSSTHDPKNGWGQLALGVVDVRFVPGDPVVMLREPHVRVLARELRACLDNSDDDSGGAARPEARARP